MRCTNEFNRKQKDYLGCTPGTILQNCQAFKVKMVYDPELTDQVAAAEKLLLEKYLDLQNRY